MNQPDPVDMDAGSDYEALCALMLIDPFRLSAEIKTEIAAALREIAVIPRGAITSHLLGARLSLDARNSLLGPAT